MDTQDLMTCAEVAHALRLSPACVARWCNQGKVPGALKRFAPGSDRYVWLVPRNEMLKLLRGRPRPRGELLPETVEGLRRFGLLRFVRDYRE
jgi:hypothetical protein